MDDPEALLHAAEAVAGILGKHEVDAVLIGAIARAAHHCVRQTEALCAWFRSLTSSR